MKSPFAWSARENLEGAAPSALASSHRVFSKESLSGKVVCALASFALAFSLVPAAAFAEVGEGANEPEAAVVMLDLTNGEADKTPVDDEVAGNTIDDAPDARSNGESDAVEPEADGIVAPDANASLGEDAEGAETDDAVGESDADSAEKESLPASVQQPKPVVSPTSVDSPAPISAQVSATCSVIGIDASGNPQTWASPAAYELDEGSNAGDLTVAMLGATGLEAEHGNDEYGFYLKTITSPADGSKIGWGSYPGKYWQFFVNGEAAETGPSGVVLNEGDSVVWYYSAWGDELPAIKPAQVSATCSVIGIDASGNPQTWASPAAYELDEGATAADLTKSMFEATGLTADYGNGPYGFYLNTITSPAGGAPIGYDSDTGKYWQFFVNGKAAETGASGVALKEGDSVVWAYSKYGDSIPEVKPARLAVSCSVIGVGADGNPQTWASPAAYELDEGATAADLTKSMFEATGLTADYGNGPYGFYLNTITSPAGGAPIGYDSDTGKYWQFFVNGEAAETGASGVVLNEGDSVAWYYSAWGDSLPTDAPGISTPDPGKPALDTSKLPDYSAEWPSFTTGGKNGAVVSIDQPISSVEKAWSFDPSDGNTNQGFSDPLIVNGDVYVFSGGTIYKVDAKTGKAKKSAPTGFPANFYFSRPSYANGKIFCAANDGRIAAFNADTLGLVWCTDALPEIDDKLYQNYSSITVFDGKALAAFTAGAGDTCFAGTLVCVNEKDGSTIWTKTDIATAGSSNGYYWTGACQSGNAIMIADDSGKVKLVDGASGNVLSSVSLGMASRSGVIALDDVASNGDGTYLAVSKDGKLHKIVRKGNKLESAGSVSFASSSTSTPSVVNGKAFVCGVDENYNGTLSVIDLETMKLVASVIGGKGSAQGSPLVIVSNNGDVFAYFTCNNAKGAVYSYKLGDSTATELYVPDTADQNYCTASLIADKDGNIYYSNDNHRLIKLLAKFTNVIAPQGGGESPAPGASQGSDNGKGEGSGDDSDPFGNFDKTPAMFVVSSGSARATGSASEAAEANTAANNTSATERAAGAPVGKSALDEAGISNNGSSSASGLPIWPVVGMVASVAVLAFIAIGRLRRR